MRELMGVTTRTVRFAFVHFVRALAIALWLCGVVPGQETAPSENTPPKSAATQPTPQPETSTKTEEPTKPALPSGKLPWARTEAPLNDKAPKKKLSARQLLVNVDDSQLNALFDNQPFEPSEEEVTLRILYRMPRFGDGTIQRITRKMPHWMDVVKAPPEYRIEFYALRGRVQSAEKVQLAVEQKERFEFGHYFRVVMTLENSMHTAIVFTRHVPEYWLQHGSALDEPASVNGLFLKTEENTGETTRLVFAATRMNWHPDREIPEAKIHADHVVLAKLGMNVDYFVDIADRSGKPLGTIDRDCFYSMLAAVGRTTLENLEEQPRAPFQLVDHLQKPREQQGKLATIEGNVRRISRIAISEPEIIERFGFDHYYELYLFVSLNDTEVRIVGDAKDKDAVVLNNGFPITFCVRSLPQAWSHLVGSGDNFSERAQITGFNFRQWAYDTQMLQRYVAEKADRMANEGEAATPSKRPLQPSPMFIAPDVRALKPDLGSQAAAKSATTFAVTFILLVILLVIGMVWFFRRGDRNLQSSMRRQIAGGAEAEDKPDFSGLG